MDVLSSYKSLFSSNLFPQKENKNLDKKLSNKIHDAMIASGGNIVNKDKVKDHSIIYLG